MDWWDNIKHTNIHIIWVPEGEERDKGAENLLEEIMAENFPNLGKEKRHPDPESLENSKQDEPKETYTKTQFN